MPLEIVDWFIREDIQANPDKIYVFGDNEARVGKGGQAKACRGEPNIYGIRTKKGPGTDPDCYWYEDDFYRQLQLVNADFWQISIYLYQGKTVVFPKDGFGTGLALLKENNPRMYKYIQDRTQWYIEYHHLGIRKNKRGELIDGSQS